MSQPKVSYNEYERKTLITLVNRHRLIIDNKRVDSETLARKQKTWDDIMNAYNRTPRIRKRATKQLRRLWENTKARAKKAIDGQLATGSSISHQMLINESYDEPIMETIHTINNPNAKLESSDCDEVLVVENGNTTPRINVRSHPKKLNRLIAEDSAISDNTIENVGNDVHLLNIDEILAPIVSARIRRNDEATEQQKELHQLLVQRERLQIKALEEQINKQTEANIGKMERERELHDLRMRQEQELHMQRMRNEQEIHQMRLAEYNKMQLATYHNAIV